MPEANENIIIIVHFISLYQQFIMGNIYIYLQIYCMIKKIQMNCELIEK